MWTNRPSNATQYLRAKQEREAYGRSLKPGDTTRFWVQREEWGASGYEQGTVEKVFKNHLRVSGRKVRFQDCEPNDREQERR